MKMAKKLLAVVLAGVMAVSMLTGCSLSDAAKAKALETALNSTGIQHEQKVDFNHKKSLDDEANKVWTKVLGDTDTARKHALADGTKFVYDSKLDGTGTNAKKYAYIVVKAGTKSSEIKNSSKIMGASTIYTATYKTTGSKLADDIQDAKTTSAMMKIADGNAEAKGLRKVDFGVKFVDDGEKENKTYYAIVVVEVKPAN